MADVAVALGVARVTLHRWARDTRFRSVRVVADPVAESVVVTISAAGVRVEGLTVETAARLVARLR